MRASAKNFPVDVLASKTKRNGMIELADANVRLGEENCVRTLALERSSIAILVNVSAHGKRAQEVLLLVQETVNVLRYFLLFKLLLCFTFAYI